MLLTKQKITPRLYAGEGYRFLKAGETTKAGDECVHMLGYPVHPGQTIQPGTSNYLPEGYYRRKVEVESTESRLTRELSEAKDQIAKLVARCTSAETTAREQNAEIGLLKRKVEYANNEGCVAVLKKVRSALRTPECESIIAHAEGLVSANSSMLSENYKLKSDNAAKDRELTDLKARLASMQKNASGNAVLVTLDGWSLPKTLPSTLPFNSVRYEGFLFVHTGNTDAFGRGIFRQL